MDDNLESIRLEKLMNTINELKKENDEMKKCDIEYKKYMN